MNSKLNNLESLAACWRKVPRADRVCNVAQAMLQNCTPSGCASADFNALLSTATRTLLAAVGRQEPDRMAALGRAIDWLGDDLEHFHLAYLAGDTTVTQAVVVALRDALLARLQADYRQYLLDTCCPDWKTRNALAQSWAEKQPALGGHQSWEFTDCIDEILDSVDAGEQLLEQLRSKQKHFP